MHESDISEQRPHTTLVKHGPGTLRMLLYQEEIPAVMQMCCIGSPFMNRGFISVNVPKYITDSNSCVPQNG